jgi:molybdopterin synthase sulfur carrier subunit
VAQLAEQLAESYPHVFPRPEDLVVAINQEYADHSQLLSGNDEVALIPPVSGGSF